MSASSDERAAFQRERALAKARRVRARQACTRRRRAQRHASAYARWLEREKAAFMAHVAEPADRALYKAWLRTWREQPRWEG